MSVKEEQSRGYKRSASDDESGSEGHGRRQKRRQSGSSRMELRMLIASREAGGFIGKGGENIKRLREEYKVSLVVSDNRGAERVVCITGEVDTVLDVVKDFLQQLEEKQRSGDRSGRNKDMDIRILIHQSQAGCIIGKGGNQLKNFRLDYKVDVKVFAQCCPDSTERVVKLIGTPGPIITCLGAILELLQQWPPKGYNTPYDPINASDYLAPDYGGFGSDRGGRDRSGGRDRRYSSSQDRSRGRGSSRDMRDNNMFGGGSFGGFMNAMSMMDRQVTTQQVSIPAELAGVIIGKGGRKIKDIRMDSGAEITISDSTSNESDRVITLTGTQSQIQNAQFMLQTCVKQHLVRR